MPQVTQEQKREPMALKTLLWLLDPVREKSGSGLLGLFETLLAFFVRRGVGSDVEDLAVQLLARLAKRSYLRPSPPASRKGG